MLTRLRKLWQDKSGVAAIEFAILAPMLVTLLIGCLEVTFKIWSTQKAEKLSVTLSDVVAQSQSVTSSDLTQLTGAVDKIMDPFPFGSKGKVIISSVYVAQDDTIAKVNWQCSYPVDGTYEAESKFGLEGDDAALPTGFTLAPRDNVIVAEVFYQYDPIAPGLMFDTSTIYRRAMFKPRLGALTVDPGC
ncbi:MAG TPA: TadE/TadG family type IV pilus assembly protein [Dongiaceae bacterium]|jgi:Flp pilus assembly pilin Flp|nr:TadE/TadG family type IV pilus assembly protein [Dongiaceae bacterium]